MVAYSRRMLNPFVRQGVGEWKPATYSQGYVEDVDKPRTTLAYNFSILLELREISGKQWLIWDHLVKRHLHAPLPLPINQ
ncbi:MAG: hypothetical protein JW388_1242 [Nitrospira sp.]|nr:hypothetical protein [Nitrospira sp.]